MALSIDYATKIITVPRADMQLVQSVPSEIRQLNVEPFRLELKDLEDDPIGMAYLDTHSSNAPVTVGGVTLARVVEIINGYTITFEDGQYAVNIVGANTNIADVSNVNQVSVRSANSAGLVDNGEAAENIILLQVEVDYLRKLLANKARTILTDEDGAGSSTIYDDDKVTPLLVFDHTDNNNRDPQ